jgi:curved DNA-binding protein
MDEIVAARTLKTNRVYESIDRTLFNQSCTTRMAVDFKDYYSVLGVPRDATDDQIKKAFRKLARLHHPDVAKDKKTAEQKFKEINEAHEVLSDPVKRRKYDALGADWESGGMAGAPGAGAQRRRWSAPGGEAEQEYHFGGTGFSDFFEQFFGGGRGGAGVEDLYRDARSRGGPGGRQYVTRGQDIEGDILVTLDEALHGSMRSISLQRIEPNSGERETETFQVRIPPGAQEGRRIRVPAKGGPGHGGGEPGDLYLRVRLAAHPDFEVRGTDLYHELELTPWEAVLGAQVLAPTLSGSVKVRIPPGTNSGTQLRVKGQGLPLQPGAVADRGNLYVVIKVNVPTQVTSEERELWEKLARTSTFRPRENRE